MYLRQLVIPAQYICDMFPDSKGVNIGNKLHYNYDIYRMLHILHTFEPAQFTQYFNKLIITYGGNLLNTEIADIHDNILSEIKKYA